MPYMEPPPGFGYDNSVEARRLHLLKMAAAEADAYMAAQRQAECQAQAMMSYADPRPVPKYGPIKPIPALHASYLNDASYPSAHANYAFDPFGMPAYNPMAFRAPVLSPRAIQAFYPPISPTHYAFTQSRRASPTRRRYSTNEALASWYADQVIELLVRPGYFRAGVNGASEDLWGPAGRYKDGWERLGVRAPDFSEPWGRMGMSPEFPAPQIRPTIRDTDYEMSNPYYISQSSETRTSKRFIAFVHEMVQRMTISPTAVFAAVWYLRGLGLHAGDGEKGRTLRRFLLGDFAEADAVEKRVALLGFLLAGKWLDDNSFLTKSWTEVTHIPVPEIDLMERTALTDYHHALTIPLGSWTDHMNSLWTDLVFQGDAIKDADVVVLPLLDELAQTARAEEESLERPRRSSLQSSWMQTADFGRASQVQVAQSAMLPVFDDDTESEDEFVEYDGAVPFLSMSDRQRSGSNLSSQSRTSIPSWRQEVYGHRASDSSVIDDQPFAFAPPPSDAVDTSSPQPDFFNIEDTYLAWPSHVDERPRNHNRLDSSALRGEPIPTGYQRHKPESTRRDSSTRRHEPAPMPDIAKFMEETGVTFEPGIIQVRPPTAYCPTYVHVDNNHRDYKGSPFQQTQYRPALTGMY